MNPSTRPQPRLDPLPQGATPELQDAFQTYVRALGFVPNSVLIMQRKPKLVQALSRLASAVWDPEGEVTVSFKRLLAHVASRAHGCYYCQAHTAGAALRLGVEERKLESVWAFRTSPLFSDAERAALEVAIAGAAQPNAVTDDMFADLKRYWSDGQIVEIVGVISLFGFMNRWNDTMATPLEDEPLEVGERHLVSSGWQPGKHLR